MIWFGVWVRVCVSVIRAMWCSVQSRFFHEFVFVQLDDNHLNKTMVSLLFASANINIKQIQNKQIQMQNWTELNWTEHKMKCMHDFKITRHEYTHIARSRANATYVRFRADWNPYYTLGLYCSNANRKSFNTTRHNH